MTLNLFKNELARSAEKNTRIACLMVLPALSLGLVADLSNLPAEHLNAGLILRGGSIFFWALILVLVLALPRVFRARYEEILTLGVLSIALSVAFIGAWAGEKGLTYFVGILQVEFALATFLTISRPKFIFTAILCNLFYVACELIIGRGVNEHFVNVAVSLVIFGLVSILAHHLIYSYKEQNFEQRLGLEQSSGRIKNILESITDAFLALDRDGRLTFLNSEAERFFSRDGKQTDDLIGKKIWEIYPALVEDSRFWDECTRAMTEQRPVRFEEFYPRLNGYFEVRVYPSAGGLSIAAHEITRRKQAEEQLKTSLEEKDVLLRHIHHGVKNNLQVISSLLNLQSHSLPAGDSSGQGNGFLRESQNRIKAMALVHEKLYESRDLASINIRDFVNSIAGNLFDSYGVNRQRIELDLAIGDIRMDVDSAVACGMVINELVSNALKYAFPGDKSGRIQIAIREQQDILFEVRDDGIGFQEPPDLESRATLGLRLVKILIEKQLGGSFALSPGPGANFIMRFRRKSSGEQLKQDQAPGAA